MFSFLVYLDLPPGCFQYQVLLDLKKKTNIQANKKKTCSTVVNKTLLKFLIDRVEKVCALFQITLVSIKVWFSTKQNSV